MRSKTLPAWALLVAMGCATRKPARTTVMERNDTLTEAASGQDALLSRLFADHPAYFDTLLRQNATWQIKVIYTEIDRKSGNQPVFTDHVFNAGAGAPYFYPASTVKLPTALLALQRLHELNIPGLDRDASMITDTAYSGQTAVYNDPSSPDGRPTIAQYIKKILLVSDNDAFNRLYEFLGQRYINDNLHRMGFDSAQILHRLQIALREDQNRHTNPVSFYDSSGKLLYRQPPAFSDLVYQQRHDVLGTQPFDFSKKNRIALADLHSILKRLIFPEAFPKAQRFGLSEDDYRFVYRYMSMRPGESDFPAYDPSYNGAYAKLLLYGGKGDLGDGIRIFNKEGDAYGFLTDVAYVVDFKNNIEFLLSANIQCNSDGVFNDDHYDYEQVGYPFLRHLGEVIYQYELERKRKHAPDLSKFKFDYGR